MEEYYGDEGGKEIRLMRKRHTMMEEENKSVYATKHHTRRKFSKGKKEGETCSKVLTWRKICRMDDIGEDENLKWIVCGDERRTRAVKSRMAFTLSLSFIIIHYYSNRSFP